MKRSNKHNRFIRLENDKLKTFNSTTRKRKLKLKRNIIKLFILIGDFWEDYKNVLDKINNMLPQNESIPMILQDSENVANLSEQQRKDLQCVIQKEFELPQCNKKFSGVVYVKKDEV
jgi:hypothetical protein